MKSRATWLQRRYDALLESTITPLLAGGIVYLGRPLRPDYASYFLAARPSKTRIEEAMADALEGVLCEYTPGDWPRELSFGARLMSMAMHNMLAASDTRLDTLFRARGRDTYLTWSSALLFMVKPATSEHDALTRFALCESLAAVRRRDITVSSFLSSHTYCGRDVPQGTFTRPRFAKEHEEQVSLDALMSTPRLIDLHAQFVGLSPLSLWQRAVAGEPGAPVSLTADMLSLLDSPRLRSVINRQARGQLLSCAQLLAPHLPPDVLVPLALDSSLARFCAELLASTLSGIGLDTNRGSGDLASLVEVPSVASLLSFGAKALVHHRGRFGFDPLRQTTGGRWLSDRLMINE